jgi:hypothetical protein
LWIRKQHTTRLLEAKYLLVFKKVSQRVQPFNNDCG